MRRYTYTAAVATSLLLFAGCGDTPPDLPRTPAFEEGYRDGCLTADGNYTKNGDRFRNETDYHEGWFEGRKRCNPSYHKT